MALLQQDRLVSIGTPLGKDVLLVESLEGTEAMSALFRFQLVLVSEKRDIALSALVGQNVTVALELAGKKFRYLNGFVSRFAQGDVDSRVSHYYAEVVPWLWFLTRTTDCRIFQKKSVPDIVQQIFKDLGFTDFKLQLQGTFEPREYCVQYRESDFNFVSRLLEEEGIFYFFEHVNAKHTLILGNDPGVHQPCPNQAQARYGYMHGGAQDKDMIARLHIEQELQPGKVTLTDYYFQTPANDLKVSTPSAVNVGGNGKFELYDYPGNYAKRFDGDDKAGKVRPDGERTAKLGMQGAEAFHKVLNGAGTCRAFTPGYKFELTEHRRADLNAAYVLTQVSHTATNNLGGGEGATYDSTFTAIPAAIPFRPAPTSRKPVVQGAQTAVVVGLPGEEIDTDKYGRVKVQFHWDREGKKDQNSSCWIRVAQPWAGKGYGTAHIPRIGSEVVVSFLEGDPDQPIILGSVYNAEQTAPYKLPDNKMVQGIKSNSTPGGGGYNEFIVNDTKGKEKITIHGQYDMDTTVRHDQSAHVMNNRSASIDVNDSESVGGDQSRTVKGNATETVEKAEKYHVKGTSDVLRDAEVKQKIGANSHLHVTGDHMEKVDGGFHHQTGTARHEKVGTIMTVEAGQEVHLKSGAKIIIEAGTQLSLVGPGGFVDIGPGGVTIQGILVKINSGGAAGQGTAAAPTAPTDPKVD